MTDLNTLTKAELNALLATPLSASALKKTSKDDLVAMFDAMSATDALDADLRDARADDPTPTDPTLAEVVQTLTDLEKRVAVAHLESGIDCNGAETLDAMRADNMTWSDVAETAKRTGLTKKQVNGVLSSLSVKGLVVTDCDPVNGEGAVQQVLSDFGIVVAFELLAEGIVANQGPKAAKADKPKAQPKPRTSEDRVITEPAKDLKLVRPATEGTKRHLLVQALHRGATVEHLCEVLGWNRSTVTSALRWDLSQMGLGCERKGEKYFLLLPAGVTALPVREKTQTRADALVAACR